MRRTILVMFLGAALVCYGCSISCTGTLEPEPDDGTGGAPEDGAAQGGAAGTGGEAGAGGVAGAGGFILPDASICFGPNPTGCFYNGTGCPAGEVCAAVGCAPSGCACDRGVWICTADCGGGTCIGAFDAGDDANAPCEGPNPAGCMHTRTGCRPGESCQLVGCTSSYCYCSNGGWVCTKDCGGGSCVIVDAGRDVNGADDGEGRLPIP